MNMIEVNKNLVSYCGLYCGSCSKYIKEICPGCHGNEKATWCKIRKCCIEKDITTCSQCTDFDDIMECKKLNNFVSRVFAFIFRSDREAGLRMIKEKGLEEFAKYMAEHKLVAIRKGNRT